MLVAAAVIAAVVVVVVVLSSSKSRKPPPPAKLPSIVGAFSNPASGIISLLPVGWIGSRGPGLMRLASRDGTSVVLVAALPNDQPPYLLLANAVKSLRQTYKNPTVELSPGSTLDGLPVRSRVLLARNSHGVPIRILVVAARRKGLGYLIEAFNSTKAPLRDLEESQEIVSSIRLEG